MEFFKPKSFFPKQKPETNQSFERSAERLQILEVKKDLERISEEIEERTFTMIEGLAYLIIGTQKHCADYDERFALVVQDYQNLLEYIEQVDRQFVQQKNNLHAFFNQPPMVQSLKEKTIGDLQGRIRIFNDVFGKEEVEKIWDAVRLESMASLHSYETFAKPSLAA